MKRCTKCGEEQPLSAFGRDRSRRDGLQVWCKGCQRAYRQANRERIQKSNQEWRAANPDKVKAARDARRSRPEVKAQRRASNQKWKSENRDKVKEQNRRSYARHAEERREAARAYAHDNPEKVRGRQKQWRGKNQEHIRQYRQANRHRDLDYYVKHADELRLKREEKRRWCVYRIDFSDSDYYLGSSSYHGLRFNNHKSKSRKNRHIRALNDKDWGTARLSVVCFCVNELDALTQEARNISALLADAHCLNTFVPTIPKRLFWVYVIQSEQPRYNSKGERLPGFFYVGMTTNPATRLRKHNGVRADGTPGLKGGGRYTAQHRPWNAQALHGPYFTRSQALQAEYALKRQKRGTGRLCWSIKDSPLCRGLGPDHPWVRNPVTWVPPTPEEWDEANSIED